MPDQLADFARGLEASLAAERGAARWLSVTHDSEGLAEAERSAARQGLTIGEVVPFGVVLGGSAVLGSLEKTHSWRRLTSWFGSDQRLGAAARHLDTVLALAEPAWATRALVALGPSTPSAAAAAPAPAALEPALHSAKARYLAFTLLDVAVAKQPALDPARVLVPARLLEYRAWQRARQRDDEATTLMRTWAEGAAERFRRKTDVTLACDYELVRDVLALTPDVPGEADPR